MAGAGDYGDFIIAVPPHTLRETLANDHPTDLGITRFARTQADARASSFRQRKTVAPAARGQRITMRGRRMWP